MMIKSILLATSFLTLAVVLAAPIPLYAHAPLLNNPPSTFDWSIRLLGLSHDILTQPLNSGSIQLPSVLPLLNDLDPLHPLSEH